jgi:hypothetical protein
MKENVFGIRKGFAAAALAAVSLAGCGALGAQEGKKITSHDGSCEVTVPADWSASGSFGIGNSADKSVNVAVTDPMHTKTLGDLKQTAQMIYASDKVVKDTAAEFQMEGQSINGQPNVYRGIQLAGKICVVEVTYTSGTIDDARKIAASLKAAK